MEHALTILGSSSALPTSQRFPTAQVLQILERFFLIDCGEGTQIQLRRANISFAKIRAIFISHLHGDHYLGIFGVLSTFNLLGRKAPLVIYAPSGFEEIVRYQLQFLVTKLSFDIRFVSLPQSPCELIYSDRKLEISAIQLLHRIPTWGFYFKQKPLERKVIKEKIAQYNLSISQVVVAKHGENVHLSDGRVIPNAELSFPPQEPFSYAYISDTLYNPKIAQYIQGVQLLYHEATFMHSMLARAKETYHSTALQAAEFAKLCAAQQLLIGHFSARYRSVDELLLEAQSVFANTQAVEDLKTYFLY